MAEQWRDISGYNGVYQVSDLGQIRNTQTGKVLQHVKMKNGRLYVTLSSDGFSRKRTESSPALYLQDIERRDMLKFVAFLRAEKNQSPRSVYNKCENVMTFLKAQGIRGRVGKNDRPRFEEEEPEVYDKEELDKPLKACDATERLWFEFFLMTGMREQEVMHCSWEDVNLSRGTVIAATSQERGGPSPRSS